MNIECRIRKSIGEFDLNCAWRQRHRAKVEDLGISAPNGSRVALLRHGAVGGGGMRVVKEQGRIPDSAKVDRFPRYYIKEKLCRRMARSRQADEERIACQQG